MCGNVTWVIILFLGGNFARWQGACGLLLNMVRLAARQLDVETPFNNLTIGMIIPKATGKPRTKLKAAEGRHYIVVLRKMLRDFLPMACPHSLLRFQCLDALYYVYWELEHWRPIESPTQLWRSMQRHLLLYAELRATSVDDNKWALTPKHHLACHAAQTCTNPRELWNYLDESEIGDAAAIASARNQHGLPTMLLSRYRAHFSL